MADVSKERLRKEIAAILKNADLTKTSAKKVREQLEEKLEVDLADQKKVVDELVMEFLKEKKGKHDEDDEENGDDDDNEEDEESDKEKKKPTKRSAPKKSKDTESEEASEEDDDDEDYGSSKKKAKTSGKKAAGGKKKKKGSDDDSDEDWAKKKTKKSGGGGGGGGKKNSGYTRAITLSPELAKLVGQEAMPRHEVVKKVWAIIKERNLYDPKNKQFAICDNDLFKVFGVKRFRTFGMMKHLKDHFIS